VSLTNNELFMIVVIGMFMLYFSVTHVLEGRTKKRHPTAALPDLDCVCEHPISMHARDETTGRYGACNGEDEHWTTAKHTHMRDCRCLRYFGELPPEDYLRQIGS